MKRAFFREYRENVPSEKDWETAEQWNIGVTGLGRSVGTTFVASSLAFYLRSKGNSLTFCQCLHPTAGRPLLYDEAAMDQRFANRSFHRFYSLIAEDESTRGCENLEQGIRWILPTPEDREEGVRLSGRQRGRLLTSARGGICVFDLDAEPDWELLLADMDAVIAVCDPLPSRLMAGTERFKLLKKLELSGKPVIWLCSRFNSGVSRRQTAGYLKTRELLWVPAFDPALIYADEYACRFHLENHEIRKDLLEIFTKVSRKLGF